MFNQSSEPLKKIALLLLTILAFTACDDDVTVTFEKQHIDQNKTAAIAINYPKAMGTKAVVNKINETIEHTIANDMNMSDTAENKMTLSDAASQFDAEFKKFKKDNEDSSQKWEVKVDGDVVYQSENVICINIQSYIDTGGAHGNSRVTYLNFNAQTGAFIEQGDIINNIPEFKKIAEKAFKEQTKPQDDEETIEDFFFGEDFQLPGNMGFTRDGLALLYNNYEIASYAQGTTKIILPYNQIKDLLKVNP